MLLSHHDLVPLIWTIYHAFLCSDIFLGAPLSPQGQSHSAFPIPCSGFHSVSFHTCSKHIPSTLNIPSQKHCLLYIIPQATKQISDSPLSIHTDTHSTSHFSWTTNHSFGKGASLHIRHLSEIASPWLFVVHFCCCCFQSSNWELVVFSGWIWLAVMFYLSHKLVLTTYILEVRTFQHKNLGCSSPLQTQRAWKSWAPFPSDNTKHTLWFTIVLTIPYCLHELKVTWPYHYACTVSFLLVVNVSL